MEMKQEVKKVERLTQREFFESIITGENAEKCVEYAEYQLEKLVEKLEKDKEKRAEKKAEDAEAIQAILGFLTKEGMTRAEIAERLEVTLGKVPVLMKGLVADGVVQKGYKVKEEGKGAITVYQLV